MSTDEPRDRDYPLLAIAKTALEHGLEPEAVAGWKLAQIQRFDTLEERRIAAMEVQATALHALVAAVTPYFLGRDAETMGDALVLATAEGDRSALDAFADWVAAGRAIHGVESQMIWEGYLGESKRTVHLDDDGNPMIETA